MIKTVISFINNSLGALDMFHAKHGICELVKEIDEKKQAKITYPAEYLTGGEFKHLKLDGANTECYHRHDGPVNRVDTDQRMGCDPLMRQTYPMLLIGFFKRKNGGDNQYTPDNICLDVINLIEFKNSKGLSKLLGATLSSVRVKSYSVDSNFIYNREFAGNETQSLNMNYFMFEIKYDIVIEGLKNCFQFCKDFDLTDLQNEFFNCNSNSFAQTQSDWTQTDNTKVDYIKNKPGIRNAAQTTDDTSTPLTVLTVPTNKHLSVDIYLRGVYTSGISGIAGDFISLHFHGDYLNVNDVVSKTGENFLYLNASQKDNFQQAIWGVEVIVSDAPTNNISIQVIGANGNNITWTDFILTEIY